MNFLQRLLNSGQGLSQPKPLPSGLEPNDPLQIAGPHKKQSSSIFNTPMRFNNGPVFNPMWRPAPITPRTLRLRALAPPHWRISGIDSGGKVQVPIDQLNPQTPIRPMTPLQFLTHDPVTNKPRPGDINVGPAVNPHPQYYFHPKKAQPFYLNPLKMQQVEQANRQPRLI